MRSLRHIVIAALSAAVILPLGAVAPALASGAVRPVDAAKLDAVGADYTQYRGRGGRGWGGRGAAIAAGAIGLGILGGAAIAANRRSYADPYYGYNGYGYAPAYGYGSAYGAYGGYAPEYDEPVVYAPPRRVYGYGRHRDPREGFVLPDGRPDPARLR